MTSWYAFDSSPAMIATMPGAIHRTTAIPKAISVFFSLRESAPKLAPLLGHVVVAALEPLDLGLVEQLADVLASLEVDAALNLDGGSAGLIIAAGRRLNTPRTDEGEDVEASSPSMTALALGRP